MKLKKLSMILGIISTIVTIVMNVRKIILNEKEDKRQEILWKMRIEDLNKEDEIQSERLNWYKKGRIHG